MVAIGIQLARQIDRVPSSMIALDAQEELRFQEQLPDYLRTDDYRWGYQAVKQGGWTAVATANFFRGLVSTPDLSLVEFEDVLQEVGLMLSDLSKQTDVVRVGNASDIEAAKQRGVIGFLPTKVGTAAFLSIFRSPG